LLYIDFVLSLAVVNNIAARFRAVDLRIVLCPKQVATTGATFLDRWFWRLWVSKLLAIAAALPSRCRYKGITANLTFFCHECFLAVILGSHAFHTVMVSRVALSDMALAARHFRPISSEALM
jgi:hypothetical protein